MDVQVMHDKPDTSDTVPAPVAATQAATRAEAARGAAVRRFEIDPASSPTLLAALAWDAAPRR